MMKGTFRILAAAAVLAMGADTAAAASSPTNDHEIRVVNHYAVSVQVFLEDAEGRLHDLGRVHDSEFKVLAIDAETASLGEFRLKIFPETSLNALTAAPGIRSVGLELGEGDSVNVYLGDELARSQIEVTHG